MAVVRTINDELGSMVSVELEFLCKLSSSKQKVDVKTPKRNFKTLIWKNSFTIKSEMVFWDEKHMRISIKLNIPFIQFHTEKDGYIDVGDGCW